MSVSGILHAPFGGSDVFVWGISYVYVCIANEEKNFGRSWREESKGEERGVI